MKQAWLQRGEDFPRPASKVKLKRCLRRPHDQNPMKFWKLLSWLFALVVFKAAATAITHAKYVKPAWLQGDKDFLRPASS